MNSTSARKATRRTALMAVVTTAAAARQAVADGASMVDLTGAAAAEISAFRGDHPGVPVLAGVTEADLTRDPSTATRTGARLICARHDDAARSGLPPDRLLIETSPDGLPLALAAGYPVLLSLPDSPPGQPQPRQPQPGQPPPGQPPPGTASSGAGAASPPAGAEDEPPGAGALAVAALGGWLGAAVVRTRYPRPVRRALDLTDSVRGVRPPARTVRGLA